MNHCSLIHFIPLIHDVLSGASWENMLCEVLYLSNLTAWCFFQFPTPWTPSSPIYSHVTLSLHYFFFLFTFLAGLKWMTKNQNQYLFFSSLSHSLHFPTLRHRLLSASCDYVYSTFFLFTFLLSLKRMIKNQDQYFFQSVIFSTL